MTYEDKIKVVFAEICEKQTDGASASDVTFGMAKRGWLSPLDTVIDIADIMRQMRDRGAL